MVRQPFDGAARHPEATGSAQLFDHVPELRPACTPVGSLRIYLSLRRSARRYPDGGACAADHLGPRCAVHRYGRRRGRDIVLGLEGIGLGARLEMVILDSEA